MQRYRLCLMHPMDPRGSKLGGIETHVRLILQHHPDDFDVLFVGVDELGDCRLGEVRRIPAGGRIIDFLPVASIPSERINLASRSLLGSTTFRYAAGVLRHLRTIRRLTRGGPASADLQRFEFAMLARALGLPAVQMVHGEGSRADKMDSLIKRYWFVHQTNERIALRLARRILCVNPNIVARMEREFPKDAGKAEVMTVSVDTDRFTAAPFDTTDGIFRIVFAGRLDEFKDPPLMFRMLARLHEKLGGRLEFHYAGTSDPSRYAEFEAVRQFSHLHGFQDAAGLSRLYSRCHAGVLTSYFEGMPCYLLETLASGRPFAALRLPQYDPLVVQGISGTLVERTSDPAICEMQLADAFAQLWSDILSGRMVPERVREQAIPYSVEVQMSRLFVHHRRLQNGAPETRGQLAAA